MGLTSWIKDKYHNHKYQNAQRLFGEGNSDGAIEILTEILDVHPDASEKLLSIYHSVIKTGNLSKIAAVANLYSRHTSLKSVCVEFSKELDSINNARVAIEYNQALYVAGIRELQSPFVKIATTYIENTPSSPTITSLTKNITLISTLSESIFRKIKSLCRNKAMLLECERLCILILPHLSSKEFFALYSIIRFDIIATKGITEVTIKELDRLFNDVNSNYKLSSSDIKLLLDEGLYLTKELFESGKYVEALLVSQRLIEKYAEARQIYSKSALKLYSTSNSQAKLIIIEALYMSLGNDNSTLANALEAYIPYSQHKEKYVTVVISELNRLSKSDVQKAEDLFVHAWGLAKDTRFINCVLSIEPKDSKIRFAQFILSKIDIVLSGKEHFATYLSKLIKIEDADFVVTTLEALMDKGKNVKSEYETQIIRFSKEAKFQSRKRIEILDRGLTRLQTKKIFSLKGEYCNNYIDSGKYDSSFAIASAQSLIRHHDLAEVLIAKILLDDAESSKSDEGKENKLHSALSFKTTHNQLFNNLKYEELLPRITESICNLAVKQYKVDQSKAIALLYLLRDNGLSWYDNYASLRLGTINKQQPSEDNSTIVLSILAEGQDGDYSVKENLWIKYIEIETSLSIAKELDESISGFQSLRYKVQSECSTQNKSNLSKSIDKNLGKQLYIRGKKYEQANDLEKAIEDYKSILDISGNYTDIKSRLYICKLKKGKRLSNADKIEIESLLSVYKDKLYQKDLAYRWCIYLISNGSLESAENINNQNLGSDPQINQICQEQRVVKQQNILYGLNDQITKLNNSKLSTLEALSLGQSLSQTLKDVNLIVQVSTQKSNAIKEAIRVYAIEKFYEAGDFVQSQKGLKIQDSDYLSDPLALRNIAIMCLRAVESGLITDDNYKELLTIWATAIYQQKIFVRSLDYTSWDDPYTFTLSEALGQLENENDELPDNVNYSDESEARVVSIREVQKALVNRMESALNDHSTYQQFFSEQLEAMDKLAEQNLDEHCVLVAPHLLTMSSTYRQSITHALSVEANAHYGNWETILEIGNMFGLVNDDFGRYANAKSALNMAISSIERMACVNSVLTVSRIDAIKEFECLKSSLISAVTTALNSAISSDVAYQKLNSDFGSVVKLIGDDILAFAFSNYINKEVVRALNEKTITLGKASPILFETYDFCKCNPHLKRNIENIIEALIHNYISDGESDNLTILSNVLSNTREYDSYVVKALKGEDDQQGMMLCLLFSSNEEHFNTLKSRIGSKSRTIQNQFNATSTKIATMKVQLELSQIVDKVNNGTISKCDALQKVYDIYKNNKDNDRVCENLSTLIPMCVIEYVIPNKAGKGKVESVLNVLKVNVSSTFRLHTSEIRQAYNMIWNELPYDAQQTMKGLSFASTLNSQGLALKQGLDYLKALS